MPTELQHLEEARKERLDVGSPEKTPIPDRPISQWPWPQYSRQYSPEYMALTEVLDRQSEMQKWYSRLTKEELLSNGEVRQMLTLIFDMHWDLSEKCELALKAANYARSESEMNRRHAEQALEIMRNLLHSVLQDRQTIGD